MARKRSPRQQKLILLAPVNWLEERSGLVGAVNTSSSAAFPPSPTGSTLSGRRRSPRSWSSSSPACAGDVLPALSGEAYDSIQRIKNEPGSWAGSSVACTGGARVSSSSSSSCTWGASSSSARTSPRELNWLIGVILLTLALAEGLTGYLLPWDQTAYWPPSSPSTSTPVPSSATSWRGGRSGGHAGAVLLVTHARDPRRAHVLITLHLYLVIRLGVTEPPWTRAAAATTSSRTGPGRRARASSRPRPRGNGSIGSPVRTEVKS